MMLFTNDRGEAFESLPGESLKEGHFLVRPVPLKPKWVVRLNEWEEFDYGIEVGVDATEDQAQLIKDCVEASMEYLLDGQDSTMENLAKRFKVALAVMGAK